MIYSDTDFKLMQRVLMGRNSNVFDSKSTAQIIDPRLTGLEGLADATLAEVSASQLTPGSSTPVNFTNQKQYFLQVDMSQPHEHRVKKKKSDTNTALAKSNALLKGSSMSGAGMRRTQDSFEIAELKAEMEETQKHLQSL